MYERRALALMRAVCLKYRVLLPSFSCENATEAIACNCGALAPSSRREAKVRSRIRYVLGIPQKTNDYRKTINQPVILSGEKRLRFAQSKFCGLSEANKQNRGANATKGYGLELWWLSFTNVTSH